MKYSQMKEHIKDFKSVTDAIQDVLNYEGIDNLPIRNAVCYLALMAEKKDVTTKPKTIWTRSKLFLSKSSDVRNYLQYNYVKDGILYASNGVTLYSEAIDLDDGFYHPNGIKADVGYSYPDITRVLTKWTSGSFETYEVDDGQVTVNNNKKLVCYGGIYFYHSDINTLKRVGVETIDVYEELCIYNNDFTALAMAVRV